MTELTHGGMETLEKQLWITKDTWFLLLEFVEADDMARDRKKESLLAFVCFLKKVNILLYRYVILEVEIIPVLFFGY